jgi:glutamyl-tRNA reductase
VLVANRTWDRARALADRIAGRPVRLLDLPEAVADVDLLLTSTGAASIIVEHTDLAPAMADRPDRPLLIIDIAVPRDVDPSIGELPGVTLLDMTDLRSFAQAGMDRRSAEVQAVDQIVQDEVERYTSATSARSAAPIVAALHRSAEAMRQRELERFRGRLEGLDDRQREAVEALTRGILGKMLHEPSVRLKESAGTPKGDRLADALRQLYDFDDDL